jgi:hypothetical protein
MPNIRVNVKKGDIYHNLKIVKELPPAIMASGRDDRLFLCECVCGSITEVRLRKLREKTKPVRSCGCLLEENRYRTHSLTNHALYDTFKNMHKRCYDTDNSAYKNYGGRGIIVCDEWHGNSGLIAFISWAENNGYKKGLTLDREKNEQGYSPSNCRWVTQKINMLNTRVNTIVAEISDRKFCDLYDKYHHATVSYRTAKTRYQKYGWNIMRALKTPVRNPAYNAGKKQKEFVDSQKTFLPFWLRNRSVAANAAKVDL